MPITTEKPPSIAQERTTGPPVTTDTLKTGNASGAKYGAGVLVMLNRTWTHIEIDGTQYLVTEAQAKVLEMMAQLIEADEYVVQAKELVEMSGHLRRPMSQIFRGSPLVGVAFRYLSSPRGYIEIMLNGAVSCI